MQSHITPRQSNRPSVAVLGALALISGLVLVSRAPRAQSRPATVHLNPVVARLAEGKPVFGITTSDLSLENARIVARAPIDYAYVDMEHSPLNFDALHTFLVGMADKGQILKKGNLQPNVALFARFPPEADESTWVVKQALDLGLMGVIFNGVDTKDQALIAVRSMRYPQLRGSPYMEPRGIRGAAPALAAWTWGLSVDDYERHADVWPLNPEGDLLAIVMIESVEGVKNIDQILSVPGVGAVFLGAGNDLRRSIGVPANSPELEAAFQTILKSCLSHKVACGITEGNAEGIAKRVKEGWKFIRAPEGAIRASRALLPAQ